MYRTLSSLILASALLFAPTAWADGMIGVTAVKLSAGANQLGSLTIQLDGKPNYTARVEKANRRLILDIQGAEVKGAATAITESRGEVSGVLVQSFGTDKKSTRVTISLKRELQFSVKVVGQQLQVKFSEGALGPVLVAERQSKTAEKIVERAKNTRVDVADIRFLHETYRDLILLDFSSRSRFLVENQSHGRSVLTVRNASLPKALERTMDVGSYGGDVVFITSYQRGDDVVFEVKRDTRVTSSVERIGNRLQWSFYEPGNLPSTLTGRGKDGQAARRARTIAVDEEVLAMPQISTGEDASFGAVQVDSNEAGAFGPTMLAQQSIGSGRRIDIDLKDADIHNVLRMIGEVARRNIVVADNVSGTVTIRLRNVPWEQALGVILQSKKLGMVSRGNLIRVAPLAELEHERDLELRRLAQKVRLAPLETRLIPVSYAMADDMIGRGEALLTSRGTLSVDVRTNTVIARDVSGALDQIEELFRALDTPTPQVLIEARIVEATSSYLKDIGIQWGGYGTMSSSTGNPTGLAFPSAIGVTGGASDNNTPTAGISPFQNQVANPNFAVNLPATVGTGQGGALGLTFGSIDNNVNLAVRLSAAETSGMLRILSSPRILTLDNLKARISQGTLIPYSQVSALGVQTVFQEAKLQLLVTPHVTADGSVKMAVKISRDEPDFNQTSARGDPTILKRQAETGLLVMDGHTAVIGGIFTRNSGRSVDQVPFFGDIPILGLLFQRRRASDRRSELVIFITPRIVNRAEALGR
ncbi:MAG: type IV pilus secretin PilQ [Polyangiaceae bacterium]|nr:type IV pilus secretin PilQ [Polyangiaceae bacterium]